MAFAQLTYRESLRDIEACPGAQPNKLYHLGFRSPVRRSTLAEANENRYWRIHAELAQRLIKQARPLYAQESLGVELNSAAYALDSTTIDLCMNLFPWAQFYSSQSAVKMHTRLDLRGSIPAFIRVTTAHTHETHRGNRSTLPGRHEFVEWTDVNHLRYRKKTIYIFISSGKSMRKASGWQAGILMDTGALVRPFRQHLPDLAFNRDDILS